MKIIGITGGIACGKTLITTHLHHLGYPVIDADEIVALLFQDSDTLGKLREQFGTTDKKELRQLIFNSKETRINLENFLHPKVFQNIQLQISNYKKSNTPVVFVSIPLLFEKNLTFMFDSTLALVSNSNVQIKRLTNRDQIDPEMALKMIQAQMPNEQKKALATYTIENNTTPEAAMDKLKFILKQILAQ